MGQLGRSGDTLVDIVADAFTGVSTALQTIKDNVGEFVDGVKAAGQFIADTVVQFIYDAMANVGKFVLIALGSIINSLPTSIQFVNTGSTPYFQNGPNQFPVDIISIIKGLEIVLGSNIFKIKDIFGGKINIETLSPNILDDAFVTSMILSGHVVAEQLLLMLIAKKLNIPNVDIAVLTSLLSIAELAAFFTEFNHIETIRNSYTDPDPQIDAVYRDKLSIIINSIIVHHFQKFLVHMFTAFVIFGDAPFNPNEFYLDEMIRGASVHGIDMYFVELFTGIIAGIDIIYTLINSMSFLLGDDEFKPLARFGFFDVFMSFVSIAVGLKNNNIGYLFAPVLINAALWNLLIAFVLSIIYFDYSAVGNFINQYW